jgi:hypothetical protein
MMATQARPRFLPAYLVPGLPLPLSDAEAIDPAGYQLMGLEDIQNEQTPESYSDLLAMQARWQSEGFAMTLIQWNDGTQGVLKLRPGAPPADSHILRMYHSARGKRELLEAEGARA